MFNCPVSKKPCQRIGCEPPYGTCIARQQLEAEQGYPEAGHHGSAVLPQPSPLRCPRTMEICGSTACDPEMNHCAHASEPKAPTLAARDPDSGVTLALRPMPNAKTAHEISRRIPRRDPCICADAPNHANGCPAGTDKGPAPIVTNTPRAGESAEQTAARSPEARAARRASDTKDTNPKDAIGILKIALSYISFPVLAEVALGMMEGGFKYGRHNYREAGVRASVYVDATFRHLMAFWEGENFDGASGVKLSHVTKAIASLTVLRDSMIRGNWVDDRPPAVEAGWIEALNAQVEELAKKFPNPLPPVTEIGLAAKQKESAS